jgi:murein L,D-transpeptidase YafK
MLLVWGVLCSLPSYQPLEAQNGQVMTSTGYYIIVDKAANSLSVYSTQGRILTYRAVFGSGDPGDKMMEGDNKTPVGVFHVVAKKIHPQWGPFLLLDYPNGDSWRKFNERKANGVIPSGARIGGGVGIHGTRPDEDYAVDRLQNWTEGCISVKHLQARQLYDIIPVGTEVLVR